MIRDTIDIYNRNIINILIASILLVIPVTFFLLLASEYVYQLDIDHPNIPIFFFVILNFTVLFPPFFIVAWKDQNDQAYRWVDMLKAFLKQFGYVLVFTLIFYIIAVYGAVLLLIPTFIGLSMILLLPLFVNKATIRDSLSSAWNILKEENIFILIDLLIIISLNLFVWSGALYIVKGFENNMFFFIILRCIINALVFPVIYIYLTIKYQRNDTNALKGQ
ncbi:hypothetical protein AN964_18475 [Heyndrickxia shackletonii]|uniref:Uncharacterized protein n=1 Tax=Heyndrickxia shackletonii TaxID=157838 RepID=A0A0Q3WSL3_9BACI|nr:hypothetical protein [Heyndrickxia shackletonii]KQL51015.1 hypothetical protein AN964_18475 [Heyndrickxia shackletonii]MBB2481864.1 hypothetical protein [Bacillus sp. APMAM]NEZ02023.1 hypothetical protein [Heyndrickxia shackletonii]RTZ54792.1 hypothetical protein EKO25_16185 [Bacillus sp. SAJ1]